jgi:hypothetical protein
VPTRTHSLRLDHTPTPTHCSLCPPSVTVPARRQPFLMPPAHRRQPFSASAPAHAGLLHTGHHHRFRMVVTSTPAARLPLPASFTMVARAGLLHTVHPLSGSPLTLAALSPNSNHRSPQPLTLTTATEPGCRMDLQSPVSSPHSPFLLCPRLC